jgi:hypothetical protein
MPVGDSADRVPIVDLALRACVGISPIVDDRSAIVGRRQSPANTPMPGGTGTIAERSSTMGGPESFAGSLSEALLTPSVRPTILLALQRRVLTRHDRPLDALTVPDHSDFRRLADRMFGQELVQVIHARHRLVSE